VVKLGLGLFVTVLFVWLFLSRVELDELADAVARIPLPMLGIALLWLAAAYSVRIVRWWVMLRALDPELPLRACAGPLLASVAANNVLPFRAGDVIRVVGFRKQLRAPAMRVLGTMLLERILDLLALLTFFFLGLRGLPDGALPDSFVTAATVLVGAGIVGVTALVLFSPRLPALVAWIAGRPAVAQRGWTDRANAAGNHLVESLALLRHPGRFGALIALSLVTWGLEGAVFATVAIALGLDIGGIAAWFSMASATLATLLPSAPGYVGTFDFFAMQSAVAHGAARAAAGGYALVVHAVLWAPLTVAGALYLATRGRSAWRVRDAGLPAASDQLANAAQTSDPITHRTAEPTEPTAEPTAPRTPLEEPDRGGS
jgi:glycosyltransferase 2 family protein